MNFAPVKDKEVIPNCQYGIFDNCWSVMQISGQYSPFRCMARQSIRDISGTICGYEMFYRNGNNNSFFGDGDFATRIMLDNAVLFDMNQQSKRLPAFINCTSDAILNRLVSVLDPQLSVLEILEYVHPSAELMKVLWELKSDGFKVALDDFYWTDDAGELVALADYIKIDVRALSSGKRRALLERLSGCSSLLIAEKLETLSEYQQALDEGFTFFQGYYFDRPEMIRHASPHSETRIYPELLRHLDYDSLDSCQLEGLIQQDSSLCYRMVRMASQISKRDCYFITSLHEAMQILGDSLVRKIIMLAVSSR